MPENRLIVVHAFAKEMEAVIARSALEGVLARTPILYVDHIECCGVDLFEAACSQDLEGIVAKLASGRYEPEATTWVRSRTAATAKRMVGDFFDERAGTLAVADLTGG